MAMGRGPSIGDGEAAGVRNPGGGRGARAGLGQDVRRGTFITGTPVLVDYQTGAEYTSLEHVSPRQGIFEIRIVRCRRPACGIEYGYSLTCRRAGDLGGAVRRLRHAAR